MVEIGAEAGLGPRLRETWRARFSYQEGPKISGALQQLQKRLGPRLREVEELIVRFRSSTLGGSSSGQRSTRSGTITAEQGQPLTSDAIVAEVRTWKPDRPGFAEGALRHELDEIVRAGMISLDR